MPQLMERQLRAGNCVPPTHLLASKSRQEYGLEILAANRGEDISVRWVARNAASHATPLQFLAAGL